MSDIKDPIIIDPPDFTPEQGWQQCKEYVERCGGLAYEDGEPNIRAAAGADPGCCSCPDCQQYFWKFGKIIQCTECGFQFNSDWWEMYSYGVSDSKTLNSPGRFPDPAFAQIMVARIKERKLDRMKHPYYRYGFEHPVEDAWAEHDKLPWKQIMEPSNA